MKRRSFFGLLATLPFALKKVAAAVAAAPAPVSPVLPVGYFPLSEFRNTGYIYAPYIPLYRTPDIVLSPDCIRFAKAYANSPIKHELLKKVVISL